MYNSNFMDNGQWTVFCAISSVKRCCLEANVSHGILAVDGPALNSLLLKIIIMHEIIIIVAYHSSPLTYKIHSERRFKKHLKTKFRKLLLLLFLGLQMQLKAFRWLMNDTVCFRRLNEPQINIHVLFFVHSDSIRILSHEQ